MQITKLKCAKNTKAMVTVHTDKDVSLFTVKRIIFTTKYKTRRILENIQTTLLKVYQIP